MTPIHLVLRIKYCLSQGLRNVALFIISDDRLNKTESAIFISLFRFGCCRGTYTRIFIGKYTFWHRLSHPWQSCFVIIMPPFEEEGVYCFALVGRYVSRSVRRQTLSDQ